MVISAVSYKLVIQSRNFLCEATTWRYLRHPNIVPFLGVLATKSHPLSIVSEWMDKGTLVEFFTKNQLEHRHSYVSCSHPSLEMGSQ
jgi:serine/threonine protein kinase